MQRPSFIHVHVFRKTHCVGTVRMRTFSSPSLLICLSVMSLNFSSNSSLHPDLDCTNNVTEAACISYILLLPLFVLVLFMGFQRWRKQRSVATAAMTSHSDIFTYNMAVMELIGVSGALIMCYGFHTGRDGFQYVGGNLYHYVANGQALLHLLTCVERYLAVLHPVTYLGLRNAGGARIRNLSIGCVWLLSFWFLAAEKNHHILPIAYASLLLVVILAVSFCCLSVLRILIRPGPGDRGGNRKQVDQTKKRAFYTIMAILGVLLLRFTVPLVFVFAPFFPVLLKETNYCLLMALILWIAQPSSLVLPLMFLQRAGKQPG